MVNKSPDDETSNWLRKFDSALSLGNIDAVKALFSPECYWRDLVAFTWNIKTMEGRDQIADMLTATLADTKPSNWRIKGEPQNSDATVEAQITFETGAAHGEGYLRLRDGKAWTLMTSVTGLKGFEEKKGKTRELGIQHGTVPNRQTWLDNRQSEQKKLGFEEQPYCLIVGGGQGGIVLGARLRRLGVPTIIIEKNERAGDSWRNRYKSLCLHEPVWFDHLPYLPFPDHWPVFSQKDKIGDWLECYTKIMELDYWTKSACKSARFDEQSKEWVVEVERDGELLTLRPKQLIFATGAAGVPRIPEFKNSEAFKGVIHHSSQHPGGEAYAGKKVVVIGSNNSAHDIASDLYEHGADVTMVQRSPTLVAVSKTLMDLVFSPLYSEEAVENGIDTHTADLISASVPYKVMPSFQVSVCAEMKKRDKPLYDGLEKVGFNLSFGDDETGLFMMHLRRGSGYYINIGASELVANGQIKLKNGQVTEFTLNGVKVGDETLPADLVVLATGYTSMNGWLAQLASQDIADKVGKCWGLGSDTKYDPGPWEGELRNLWKPTQQEALWFQAGGLQQSRYYSLHLALQLKARMEGIPTPVYDLQQVHHTS